MEKLQLEFRNDFISATSTFEIDQGNVIFTPPINDKYWIFKIKLFKNQSIIAFPKFSTIGIGFTQEEDCNINLPYICETEYIFNYIKRNKKYDEITKEQCIEAINIIKKAIKILSKRTECQLKKKQLENKQS